MPELRSLAKDVYDELGVGDEAVKMLVWAIQRAGIVDEAVRYAASVLLHEAKRFERGAALRLDYAERTRGGSDPIEEEEYEAPAVFVRWRSRWPLSSGKPLEDATEPEIREQIEIHARNEKGNRQAREFLEAILDLRKRVSLDPNAPCRAKLTEDDIAAVYRRIYGAS